MCGVSSRATLSGGPLDQGAQGGRPQGMGEARPHLAVRRPRVGAPLRHVQLRGLRSSTWAADDNRRLRRRRHPDPGPHREVHVHRRGRGGPAGAESEDDLDPSDLTVDNSEEIDLLGGWEEHDVVHRASRFPWRTVGKSHRLSLGDQRHMAVTRSFLGGYAVVEHTGKHRHTVSLRADLVSAISAADGHVRRRIPEALALA